MPEIPIPSFMRPKLIIKDIVLWLQFSSFPAFQLYYTDHDVVPLWGDDSLIEITEPIEKKKKKRFYYM